MTNKDWTIIVKYADPGVPDQVVYASSEQLLEATRNRDFADLIEGTWVEADLVAYGEAVQDGLA